QVQKSPQVCLSCRPLRASVHKDYMDDSTLDPFLILLQFPAYEITFINRVTHFAAPTGEAPVLLDFPDDDGVCQGGDCPVEPSSTNMQPIGTAPNAPTLRAWIRCDMVGVARADGDCGHGRNDGLQGLMMLSGSRS